MGTQELNLKFDPAKAQNVDWLKTYWSNVDMAITHDNDNPIPHLEVIRQHQQTAMQNRESNFGQVFFGQLQRLVLTMFERSFPNEAWLDAVNQWLSDIMSLMITLIEMECPLTAYHIQSLEPMFRKDKEYYSVHGRAGDKFYERRERFFPTSESETFAVLDPEDQETSVRYVEILNEFGQLGGFEIVFKALLKQGLKDSASSRLLADFLKIVEGLLPNLRQTFKEKYVTEMHGAVMALLDGSTDDDLRKVPLDDVASLLDSLATLARRSHLGALTEDVQRFKLAMALRFVKLPFFDASLKGIEQITHLICEATGDKTYMLPKPKTTNRYQGFGNTTGYPYGAAVGGSAGSSASAAAANTGDSVITTELLLNWLKENDIINVIFKLAHYEALRRCTQIVRFIAKEDSLEEETINTIWKASHLHESLQKEVFTLIEEILDVLPTSQIDMLYEKIRELPPSAYNNQVLTFVMNFTKKALKTQTDRNEEAKPYGLTLFWGLLSAGDADSPGDAVVEEACGHLVALLADDGGQREVFLQRFVDNLREGRIVAVSLKLISSMLRSSPAVAKDAQAMEEKYQLTDSILGDLARCTPDVGEEAILARLSFLEFILTESPLTMSAEQVTQLWDSIVALGQADLAFQWLETVQYSHLNQDPYGPTSTKYPAFSADVVGHLFTTKMTSLPIQDFSLAGIRMYIRSFVSVNSRMKNLRRLAEREFIIRNVELVGVDRIWDVAFNASEDAVSTYAVKFLGALYKSATKKAADSMREKRASLAVACADNLRAVAEGGDGDDLQRRKMLRCLALLTALVNLDADNARRTGKAGKVGPVLSSSAHFPALFKLLERSDIRDGLWTVLTKLPVNAEVEAVVANVDGEPLPLVKYLEEKEKNGLLYPMHLLYVLEILQGKMNDAEWRRKFIRHGGVPVLVSVFTTKDLLTSTAVKYGRLASSVLVQVINTLFTCGDLPSDVLSKSLDGTFVHRLMTQISQLATQGAEQEGAAAGAGDDDDEEEETAAAASTAKKGTRIANTWYSGEKKHLTFSVVCPTRYRAAFYCVDYNTRTRVQEMTAHVMEGATAADAPGESDGSFVQLKGEEFHNGQWVIYDVPAGGTLNLHVGNSNGPNWVVSALLLDKAPADAEAGDGVRLVAVDSKTQGKWRGKYGSCGGVLLGKTDYTVPQRPDVGADAPKLADFGCTTSFDRYEWVRALTADPRAMQQVPHDDEMDHMSDGDDEEEEAANDSAPTADAAGTTPTATDGDVAPPAESGHSALLDMLRAIAQSDGALRASFFAFPALDQWLFGALVACPDPVLRAATAATVKELAGAGNADQSEEGQRLLTVLASFVDRLDEVDSKKGDDAAGASGGSFAEYFDVMPALLPLASSSLAPLFSKVVDAVRSRPVIEDDDMPGEVDDTLAGLLHLGGALVRADKTLSVSDADVREVFTACLFGFPAARVGAPNLPKCKSSRSREAAFAFLSALVESDPSGAAQKELAALLETYLCSQIELPNDRQFSIELHEATPADNAQKEARGGRYAGLVNQGCTCYINATLQQFFIIPALRSDILNVQVALEEPPPPEETEEAETAVVVDPAKSNIMVQLQTMFAYMQEGKYSYVDTIDFCRTVRMQGRPIDLRAQEDANDFFNTVSDHLERCIPDRPERTMFRDTFGGREMGQVISEDCAHSSNRYQPFLSISCKVQSKRNLYESLDFYVKDDVLDGYRCEDCGEELKATRLAEGPPLEEGEKIENPVITAKKRTLFELLPNILAIHLNRFEFDFETLQEIKVNDRFEFPHHLNMKPYTVEGVAEKEGKPVPEDQRRPDDYFEYELAGILVHSGYANGGHYYSYIRDRDAATGELLPNWFEFNDRNVTPFSADDIPDQTFGGKYSEMSAHMKSYSAYMLFYDRKVKYPADEFSTVPLSKSTGANAAVEPQILNTIWQESVKRGHQRRLMTRPSLDFMWRMISAGAPPTPDDTCRALTPEEMQSPAIRRLTLATKFACDVLVHIDDTAENGLDIERRIAELQTVYASHTPACVWLLQSMVLPECRWLAKSLLGANDLDVRGAMAKLIITALSRVAPHEREFYLPDAPPAADGRPVDRTLISPAASIRFINTVVGILHSVAAKAAVKLNQILLVLLEFAKLGRAEVAVLLHKNAVIDLVSLYEAQTRYPASYHPTAQKLPELVALLELLMTSCDNPLHTEAKEKGAEGLPESTGLMLPKAALDFLFRSSFLSSILRNVLYVPYFERIFIHWCYGNGELSTTVIEICLTGANRNTSDIRAMYFRLLNAMLDLADNVHTHRVDAVVSGAVGCVMVNAGIAHFRDPFLEFLFNVAEKDAEALAMLTERPQFGDLIRKYDAVRAWIAKHDADRYARLFEPAFGPLNSPA